MSFPTSDDNVLLFEDSKAAGFGPITATRPVFELRCGVFNLRERLELLGVGDRLRASTREVLRPSLALSLAELGADLESGLTLLINGRLLASVELLEAALRSLPEGEFRCFDADSLLFARCRSEDALQLAGEVSRSTEEALAAPPGLRLVSHHWQLVHANGTLLCDDFRSIQVRGGVERRIFGVRFDRQGAKLALLSQTQFGDQSLAMVYPGVHIVEADNVLFGPDVMIKPGAVLDATLGPIILSAGVMIEANATLCGPIYLGPGCVVNPGAKIREGSSLGSLCKIGGEVEETVMLDLSNKQHDGFLGHAYVGAWVNLGADTNGSDLKNNYGPVRVDVGAGPVDSGERFVGPCFGDHVKTGINTMLSTGAVLGVCANVFGAGFPPRFVGAFRWGGAEALVPYVADKAIATAATVFGRRDAVFCVENEQLLRAVASEDDEAV